MQKFGLLLFSLFFYLAIGQSIYAQAPTSAWINEFHYDNAGGDVGEFVEVIVNQGFSDLGKLKISFYDGNTGSVYNSRLLSSFDIGTTQDGFTIYSKLISAIQNGLDGIAIDYNGTLISGQFLSYEGTFTAVGGPADGLMSTDIGVSQGSSTPTGSSVGLTGTGTQYLDFTWTNFDGIATIGTANGNQSLPVELSSFSASVVGNGVKLNWRTETEVNNYGFEILRQSQNDNWRPIGFVEGNGNSNSPKEYYFVDNNVISGKHGYRLKQIDNDGKFEYSKIIEIDIDAPLEFELSQNYPNPFNPSTTIKFSLPVTSNVKLSVFNILGEEVQILMNETKEAGIYTINFNASQLNSGIYFYQIRAASLVKERKMNLVK